MLWKRMALATSDSDTCKQPRGLLSVRNLTVSYRLGAQPRPTIDALRGVTVDLYPGSSIGLLGESGCGKSTLLLAIPKLLPSNACHSGSIRFEEQELLSSSEKTLCGIRGSQIGLILPEAGSCLNPVQRVGKQVSDLIKDELGFSDDERQSVVQEVLEKVGLGERRLARSFPHELSGGQQKRVLIAQALVRRPKIMLADEPTASLDNASQTQIAELLCTLRARDGLTMLTASHDPWFLRRVADQMMVMYAGEIIETGGAEDVMRMPRHPYTQALLNCAEAAPGRETNEPRRPPVIPGMPPQMDVEAAGCRFAPRCAKSLKICSNTSPALITLMPNHEVRCHLYAS